MERFYRPLKYEHLYRLEIPDAVALAEEMEGYRALQLSVRESPGSRAADTVQST